MEEKSSAGTVSDVRPGARRRIAPYWTVLPCRNPPAEQADPVMRAILELSREDEELGAFEDRGPILFKDGIFQIDMEHPQEAPGIDPNLKGLIDSIMHPT